MGSCGDITASDRYSTSGEDGSESESATDAPSKLALPPAAATSSHMKQSTLGQFNYFYKPTAEERAAKEEEEKVSAAERRQEVEEKEQRDAAKRALKVKVGARDRQRKSRANRAEKAAAEKRAAGEDETANTQGGRGKKVRTYCFHVPITDSPTCTQLQRLKETDDVSSAVVHTLAESSRPHREFKRVQQQSRKKTRPRREGPYKLAERVNWQAPHLWLLILAAARTVGYPWVDAEIVRRLKHQNPELFSGLRTQRLSDWRDKTVTHELRWKENVLKRVARGYRQGFDNTRKTILVSYTDYDRRAVEAYHYPSSVTTPTL